MRIRRASPADMRDIRDLIAAFPEHLLQTDIPDVSEFFVAEYNRAVIGCCALVLYSRRLAEIRSLAVLPQYHGNGIGKKLVASCLSLARQSNITRVISISDAVPLFVSCGFKPLSHKRLLGK